MLSCIQSCTQQPLWPQDCCKKLSQRLTNCTQDWPRGPGGCLPGGPGFSVLAWAQTCHLILRAPHLYLWKLYLIHLWFFNTSNSPTEPWGLEGFPAGKEIPAFNISLLGSVEHTGSGMLGQKSCLCDCRRWNNLTDYFFFCSSFNLLQEIHACFLKSNNTDVPEENGESRPPFSNIIYMPNILIYIV